MTAVLRIIRRQRKNKRRKPTRAPRWMTVLGIDERTAAVWDDGTWRVEGQGSVTAYRDGRRVELADSPSPA